MKSIPKEIEADFKKLESYIDIGKNNIEEDYHCIIENESKTWFDELKNKSTKFYYSGLGKEKTDNAYDNEAYHFLYFLSVQLFRTQASRERWIFSFQKAINSCDFNKLQIQKENINLDNLVHHFFWFFQSLLEYSLRNDKAHLTLLISETDIPFITSDQPVINLKAHYYDNLLPSTGLMLYYPISPDVAITVNDENKDQVQYLSEEEIIYYNEAISKASLHDIYANSKDSIENIKRSFEI